MRRLFVAPILAATLVFGALVAPVGAITGGQPDGNGHPQTALLLAPGLTFCSGALIAPQTILTAGHCTSFWTELALDPDIELETIMVSFDAQASVDEDWMPDGGTWYSASSWATHPGYVEAAWPFTYDYGLLYLDAPVGIAPATLADPGTLDPIINGNGQTNQRFEDVGYGVQGNEFGGGPPRQAITWERKVAVQRYTPGNGSTTGIFHETWFILNNAPSPKHGGPCGGDSGSPVFLAGTTEIVAVHTGGYRLGLNGVLCGRLTSLNHRTDIDGAEDVYTWITENAS
jgi:Trypsin